MSRSASYTPSETAVSRFRLLGLLIVGEPSGDGGQNATFLLDTSYGHGYLAVLRPRSRRAAEYSGGVAQLGERVNGIHEVRGSIPLASIRAGGGAAGAKPSSLRRAGGAQ